MPAAYADLVRTYEKLEQHYRDMQDIEFTIQKGKLWMLQTRTGKRTAKAMVRIAVEMVQERMISADEAVLRADAGKLDELLHPMLDPKAEKRIIARGLPASPGAAVGKVVFHADDAVAEAQKGERVVLVRVETSPEDIHGMTAAQGILTARGGMTSHAAVVARGMGKCCVAGAGSINVDYGKQQMSVNVDGKLVVVKKGDVLSLDGAKGEVILGAVPMSAPALDEDYQTLMKWVDERRRLKVRTNADTPTDAQTARNYGAEGIGLCRTEHMFFAEDKILAVRQMILADSVEQRQRALDKILPMQQKDFAGHLPRDGRAAGHHPPARSAAARVLADGGRADRRGRRGAARQARRGARARRRAARIESDARPSRLPPGDHEPRDLRDAGARDHRSGVRGQARRRRRQAGDHDPDHRAS